MNPCRIALVIPLALIAALGGWSEDLTLDQALATALERGPDSASADATLLMARAADAQAQARAGLSLTSSLSYQAAKVQNSTPLEFSVSKNPLQPSTAAFPARNDNLVPQQAAGTLTLALPTTSVAGTGTETFQVNPDGSLLTATSIGATLNQTLLTGYWGGQTQAAADKSRLTLQAAQASAGANRNKALLAVKTAYFNLLAAQDRLALSLQTLGQRQDALKFTQAKAQSGTATAYDVRVAQAAVRSAELDGVGGQNALVTAQKRLANLLGLGDGAVLRAVSPPDLAPAATADEAVSTALKNRVELQTAALSARSSGIDAALAASGSVPTIVLTGGVTFTRTDTMITTSTGETTSLAGTVGLRITPPTIDGGSVDNQTLQARTQQNLQQAQWDQLRKTIPVDVTDAWNTWKLNGQRLELAQAQVENADVNRQILKSQFDSGAKVISDWLNAEVAFSTAQTNLVNARLTTQLSAATLQNLMGQ